MATMTLDKIEQKAIANQAAAEAEAKKRWLALAADHLDGKKLDEAEVLETARGPAHGSRTNQEAPAARGGHCPSTGCRGWNRSNRRRMAKRRACS